MYIDATVPSQLSTCSRGYSDIGGILFTSTYIHIDDWCSPYRTVWNYALQCQPSNGHLYIVRVSYWLRFYCDLSKYPYRVSLNTMYFFHATKIIVKCHVARIFTVIRLKRAPILNLILQKYFRIFALSLKFVMYQHKQCLHYLVKVRINCFSGFIYADWLGSTSVHGVTYSYKHDKKKNRSRLIYI